jgi:hypothetical protein
MRLAPVAAAAVFLLAGCGGTSTAEDPASAEPSSTVTAPAAPTPAPTDPGGDVDWSRYAPAVKERIAAMAAAKDCPGLQKEFDTAYANDDATRARTGEGSADLMTYINNLLQQAECPGY